MHQGWPDAQGHICTPFFFKCLSQTDLLSNASDDFLYQGNDSSLVFVILDFFFFAIYNQD